MVSCGPKTPAESPKPSKPASDAVASGGNPGKCWCGACWLHAGSCISTTHSTRTSKRRLAFRRLCAGTQQYDTVAHGGSCGGLRQKRRGPAGTDWESPGSSCKGTSQSPAPALERAGEKSSKARPGLLLVLFCAASQQIFVRSEIQDLKRWRENAKHNRNKKCTDLKARAKEDEAVQS